MIDPTNLPGHRRSPDFGDLMRYRIMEILLVATPYDTFLLEEAGELSERILGEFRNLDLHYAPTVIGVATGAEALEVALRRKTVGLIITTPHVADMSAAELARRVREEGLDLPVVLLAWNTHELGEIAGREGSPVQRSFLWQGEPSILFAIFKSVEDRRNAEHDTRTVGVQVILLIEDDVRNYSSFLPAMYSVLLEHSQRVIKEGLNVSQKILRMRARPKILLCSTFEEAEEAFEKYRDNVLGIISDVEFPRGGVSQPQAGAEFARMVYQDYPDIPIVLHSSHPENEALARQVGASFLLKGSPHQLDDLHALMLKDFGFGDFVFRTPEGEEVDRAADLKTLEDRLKKIPERSLVFHAARNHFSRWLKARTAFRLADALRPRKVGDYRSPDELREHLIRSIRDYRFEQSQMVVADFDRTTFDFSSDFYRLRGGSLGGKARGLAFIRRLLAYHGLRHRFPGIEIAIPSTLVLGTDAFDRFLQENDLRHFAIDCEDDRELWWRFREARFPEDVERDLEAFLRKVRWPLAVRSSSLLEDSQHQPFTGVYDTVMLPNGGRTSKERLERVLLAVKRVYASTFSQQAKGYLRATPYRLEEERMAVLLQRVVGAAYGSRFYPSFSGVARSHDFYPSPPAVARDGVAAVALGLGRGVVEGGSCLRFSPRWPRHAPQLSSTEEARETTQRELWALDLGEELREDDAGVREKAFPLKAAEEDGTLAAVASTYLHDDDTLHHGLARPGTRLVTFAPVLKHDLFPLGEVLTELLGVGEQAMGGPVEIEFAVNLHVPTGRPREFGFLQVRPMNLTRETEAVEIGKPDPARVLCYSRCVLGNGRIEGIRDLVVVDFRRFERARSREAAAEVGRVNGRLLASRTPYVLIGVGRWGSRDPWLGIPVTWDQVSGARVIVEAGLRDMKVVPSQGSHFFQNLTSFHVGYFTVNPDGGDAVDWDWLDAQPTESQAAHVRHLRLPAPVLVKMDGRHGEGIVLKPK